MVWLRIWLEPITGKQHYKSLLVEKLKMKIKLGVST